MKLILFFIGVAVIGALLWGIQTGKIFDRGPISHEFTGTLEEYKDGALIVNGIYTMESEGSSPQEITAVRIIVAPDTKIIRTVLTLPTREELAKTNGRFDTEKLARADSEADLSTFQKDISGVFGIGIFARSNENIIGKTVFTASEINYRTVIRP